MRILEGKELDDALKQMQEWEAKKAKAYINSTGRIGQKAGQPVFAPAARLFRV